MNDKERLKKLQNGSVFDNDDINWLLEQAKLTELTIQQNSRLAIEFERLQIKNNQYHEALEFYADEDNHDFEIDVTTSHLDVNSPILNDRGEKARKALGDEE